MKKNLLVPVIVTIFVVVGGGSFYLGMQYGQKGDQRKFTSPAGQFNRNGGQGFADRQIGQGGGFVNGEIIAKDDKSITIKLPNDGSKIVFYSDTTQIGKTTDGAAADLVVGKTVTISGTAGSDGSMTAQSIQVRPDVLPQPATQPTEQPKQ